MGRGSIKLNILNKNSLKIKTTKNRNFLFEIKIKTENNHKILVDFDNKNNIHIKKGNSIKSISFLFSKKTSYSFLKKIIKNQTNYFPNFASDAFVSKSLLKNIKAKFI